MAQDLLGLRVTKVGGLEVNIFQPNEKALLDRMRRIEDHFTERKVSSDLGDILKTLIAFGNSTPANSTAVLYLGVRDEGEIETPQPNLESIQITYRRDLEKIYPPLQTIAVGIKENDREALAVVVPHSETRPHFGGAAWVRTGSASVKATPKVYEELVHSRNSKTYFLQQHRGEQISVVAYVLYPGSARPTAQHWESIDRLVECNAFYVTIENEHGRHSYELERISISYDDAKDRLALLIKPTPY